MEKDGLTMKKFLKPPAGPSKTELPSVDENPITYVDAVLPVIPKKK